MKKYDVVHDAWEFVTPMKYKRFMHAAVITTTQIYPKFSQKIS